MRRTTTWSIALVTSLAISGATGATVAAAATTAPVAAGTAAVTVGGSQDPTTARLLATIEADLPADWRARKAAALERFGIERSTAQEAVERAIDPTQYQCAPTRLDAYVGGLLAGVDPRIFRVLASVGALDYATYDAILFGSQGAPGYALPKAYVNELSQSFRAAQKFWDTDGSDIQLMAMHGDLMTDPARISPILQIVFGVPRPDADAIAAAVAELVATDPGLQGGQSPIFTLNAFAFSAAGETDPALSRLPDKLVFGDGMLDALQAIGVGDIGPRAVLGHEYAHHVQYDAGLTASPLTGPEATRRTELMADAFGTYFVTHKRGLALNAARVLEAEQSFYQVGDCGFDRPGHHGTPNQRLAASTWGWSVADAAQKQGHVLPSLTLDAQFEAKLPELVAPDA
ncbi:MAG: hypothetical protein HOQ18_14730 [Dermatophilaceae bacterium]|nr:hypothetical protein [Dermatophilaceae bacterium]NUO92059.1 hypothetical protein [Dermatophilaceae bacterium]NUR80387.1 hypothetical protein [Dermatophilaceae bacterium]